MFNKFIAKIAHRYSFLSFVLLIIQNNIDIITFLTGQVLDQERRVVVCRYPLGDPPPSQIAAVRRIHGPPSGGEPVTHARGRRPV